MDEALLAEHSEVEAPGRPGNGKIVRFGSLARNCLEGCEDVLLDARPIPLA